MPDDAAVPVVTVRVDSAPVRRFTSAFHVGRSPECAVQVDDDHVSRKHVLVSLTDGRWNFTDLQSANGVFVNGMRVATGPIGDGLTLRLGGTDGPTVVLRLEHPAPMPVTRRATPVDPVPPGGSETMMIASYQARYFGTHAPDEPAGPQTMYIRKAFQQVQKKQRRKYGWVLGVLAAAAFTAAAYALYLHVQASKQRQQAEEFFYSMKEMDVRIARAEQKMAELGRTGDRAQMQADLALRRQAEARYEKFLEGLNIYGRTLTEEEKLILRVTRRFGECELVMPREYLAEVGVYIQKWKSTRRFPEALKRAQDGGYVRRIADEFTAQSLPPQFFYLAMQESDFKAFAVGTPTNWGFAKGMWQFIPATGKDYGLKIGPLSGSREYDPGDERFQWEKATVAAAKYIKTIYATDAQASGLLVMASYNWGERRVIGLIRGMPDNPRDRNFWKLLEQHRAKIPKQTYDYVFSIVSAAVIGENPRLFGFPFDNPLEAAAPAAATATPRDDAPQVTARR